MMFGRIKRVLIWAKGNEQYNNNVVIGILMIMMLERWLNHTSETRMLEEIENVILIEMWRKRNRNASRGHTWLYEWIKRMKKYITHSWLLFSKISQVLNGLSQTLKINMTFGVKSNLDKKLDLSCEGYSFYFVQNWTFNRDIKF